MNAPSQRGTQSNESVFICVSLTVGPLTYKGGLAQEASMDADAAAGVRLLYDGALLPVPSIEKQVQ